MNRLLEIWTFLYCTDEYHDWSSDCPFAGTHEASDNGEQTIKAIYGRV